MENYEGFQEVEEISGSEDTITILSNYVINFKTDLDSSRLDNMVRTLYTEALSIE